MDSRNMDSRFGNNLDQRYQDMDGFKHTFTTMTKADFAMVIDDVRNYKEQNSSIFLTRLLGNRCIGYM